MVNHDFLIADVVAKIEIALDPIERGRLFGQLKSLKKGQRTLQAYNDNPKRCIKCEQPIEFKYKANQFCSRSCAATYNNTGRVVSQETRRKIQNTIRKVVRPAPTLYALVCEMCSSTFETKRKISRFCSRACVNQYNAIRQKEYALTHSELTYRRNPYKQSYMEQSFEHWLLMNGIKRGTKGFLTEVWFKDKQAKKLYRADFVFPRQRVVIELDGAQHKHTLAQDQIRDAVLRSRGWTVLRITHLEYKKQTKIKEVKEMLTLS